MQMLLGSATAIMTIVIIWSTSQNSSFTKNLKDVETSVKNIEVICTNLQNLKQNSSEALAVHSKMDERIYKLEYKTSSLEIEIPKLKDSIDKLTAKLDGFLQKDGK